MKLSGNIVIPQGKLLQYLLLPREENDKSRFLASAGYSLVTWSRLNQDLRQLILNHEVSEVEDSPYGQKYTVRGSMRGPNGQALHVMTIWIKLEGREEMRFVTLFPDKGR